jgi:hypothetical protein
MKSPYDRQLDKLKVLLERYASRKEICKELNIASTSIDGMVYDLSYRDQKFYPKPLGNRTREELVVGKNLTLNLSKSRISGYKWIQPGDRFTISVDGQNLVLKYLSKIPPTPVPTEETPE